MEFVQPYKDVPIPDLTTSEGQEEANRIIFDFKWWLYEKGFTCFKDYPDYEQAIKEITTMAEWFLAKSQSEREAKEEANNV